MTFSTTYLDGAGVQIRKVVGKREELCLAVIKSEAEVATAMARREEVMTAIRQRKEEGFDACRRRMRLLEWVAAREADSAYFSHKLLRLPRPRIRSGPPSTLLSTRYFYFSSALSVQRSSKHSAALFFPARLT